MPNFLPCFGGRERQPNLAQRCEIDQRRATEECLLACTGNRQATASVGQGIQESIEDFFSCCIGGGRKPGW